MSTIWSAAIVAAWVTLGLVVFMMVGVLRQLGLIQLRLGPDPGVLITKQGLERGTIAPNFEAEDISTGSRVQLSDFRGRPLGLVFLSTGCLACRELIPHLNQVARDEQAHVAFLTVCSSSVSDCGRFSRSLGLSVRTVADPTNVIAESFGIDSTPFAFLIDEDGVVRMRGVVNNWSQLEALLREEGTLQTREFADAEVSESSPIISPSNGLAARSEAGLVTLSGSVRRSHDHDGGQTLGGPREQAR